jgi:hypothetical protein
VKKTLLIAVTVVAALGADAATVVLKGGKKLDVAGFQRQGNYLIVKYADGRAESYPAAAVDLEATRAANVVPGAPAPAPTAAPSGPHSPFFGAQSTPGKPAVVVTDNDVQHVQPPDEGEGTGKPVAARGVLGEAEVVLVDYTKQKVDDTTWEVTATVVNKGGSPASGVSADVRLLDAKGVNVGAGTATLAGNLGPGQQGSLTARISSPIEPVQIGFSFRWTSLTPQPTPVPSPAAAAPPAAPAAKPPASAAAQKPPGYTVPPGSSPNTLASEPMAVPPNLTAPPTVLQVPRGKAPEKQPG